jgi:hypothetical protein
MGHIDALEEVGAEWRVVECKVPSMGGFRRFERHGLTTDWLIQTQHYIDVIAAHLASHGETLRPESRYVVFSPELDAWQFPLIERDVALTLEMVQAEVDFWALVEAGTPPVTEGLPVVQPLPGEIRLHADDAATVAIEALAQSIRILRDVEAQKEEARDLLLSLGLSPGRYLTPQIDGSYYQLNLREQAGRTTLDTKALRASHPEIDTRFEKQGKPFFVVDVDERRAK